MSCPYGELLPKEENPDPEKPKVRENQTEDQINRNAAEYYHTQKETDKMKTALNRIGDIPCRVMYLEKKFDGENDYIKLAASILLENGQTRNAASLYFNYGYTQEALPLFRKDREIYMIGRCLYLDSLLKSSIRPDGSAVCTYSTSLKEVTLRLEQAISYFKKCKYKDKDRKCNFGKITNEIDQSNLLLGRLTGQQHFIGTAFRGFVKRRPHNEVGKLECLCWMIYNSNLREDSELSKVMIGMENLLNIFSFLVPFSKQLSKSTEQKKEQFLRDNGIETEIGHYFYNPIHKPRILEVLINVRKSVPSKTVKTVVNDVPDIYKVIVEDIFTKSKVWFYKISKLIDDERQKLKMINKPLGKSQNIGDKSPKVSITKVSFTQKEFLQLIWLDMHNVKLEQILNECNKKLGLNREQNLILNQSEQRSFQFSKCRRLMEDLIHTVPHISNTKPDLFESLNGVRSQMEVYFESELTSSKKIENSVARFFELIFFKKAWTTDALICASKEASFSDDIPDFLEKNIEILAGIRGNINIISIVFRRLDEYLLLQESSEKFTRGDESLSSIIDMAEDVILLSMQKGDSLIKCAWDNQKKHISKEQIESVFNTREGFFLPQTIRILSDPTSSSIETNEEIQIVQEIEIDEDEIRTVREDHVTVEKKKIENFILPTLNKKESKVSIGNDEFLDDTLFAVVSVNEGGCDVCGCSFEGIGDDEDGDGAVLTTNHALVRESPSSSTVSMSLKSIAKSLSSTTTEHFPVATSAKTQSNIPNEQHSALYLSQRSVSLESEDKRDFVRSLSSTSDDQAQLTMQAFEQHTASLSHKTKMKEVQIFYEDYKKYIKPGLEKVRQFITKYELSSGDISERYGGDEIRISQLLSRFEDCNTDLAEMIKSKQWKTTKNVEKKLKQLVQLKSNLRDSVKELSSVKLKTDIAEPHNDLDELKYKPQNKKKKRRNKGREKNNWRKIDMNVVD
ncbi:hypothetical protein AM593_03766, partial [Mytilus galloprovincialis]